MAHNVFISWSGDISRKIATLMHEWLPSVIQATDPFMSEKDIDAGTRGLDEIASQLKDIKVGIICITSANQSSPWLNFEAGALSKYIERTHVIPLTLDLEKGQIKNPLGQFQAVQFNEDDMRHLVETIHKALGQPLRAAQLDRAFDLAWPGLNTRIEPLRGELAQQSFGDIEPKRSVEDMLEELIVTLRDQSTTLKNLQTRNRLPTAMNSQLAATEWALSKLGKLYGMDSSVRISDLKSMAPTLDDDDWKTIATSPFLVWYLDAYHGIVQPQKQVDSADPINDVPF